MPAKTPAAAAGLALDCGPPVAGSELLLAPGTTALFGESHGSAEIPALFGRLVCSATKAQEVVVGLEIPHDQQPLLDGFLASDGGAAAQDALRAGSFWHSPIQDGRSSQAMWALLERLRVLRAAGARLTVVAFDILEADMATQSGDRDQQMAARLLAARAAQPEAVLLALTGNLHARLRGGLDFAPDMIPMGVTMQAALPSLVAFDARYGAGTIWACMGPPPVCGQYEWGHGQDVGPARLERTQVDAYSGLLHVGGPLSPSLPVVQ